MEESKEWASATLKEVPFWREDMGPEEYDREREYLAKNWDLVRNGTYVPLWKQNSDR
jgi:hypothetical protein